MAREENCGDTFGVGRGFMFGSFGWQLGSGITRRYELYEGFQSEPMDAAWDPIIDIREIRVDAVGFSDGIEVSSADAF